MMGLVSNVEKTGKTLPVVRDAVRIRFDETSITGGKLADGERHRLGKVKFGTV